MTDHITNDNQSARPTGAMREPDAHGQAALLLVESILHGLIERSVVSVADAVSFVETAAEVKEEVAADLGDSRATMERSLALLGAIQHTLTLDLPQ